MRDVRGWVIVLVLALLIGGAAYFAQPRQDSPQHSSASDAVHGTSATLRRWTMTWRIAGHCAIASSAVRFMGIAWPRREKTSAVISTRASQLSRRVATAWAPKPEKHGA